MMPILDRHLADDPVRLVDVGARGGIDARWGRFARHLDVTGFEADEPEAERLAGEAAALPYPARFFALALGAEGPTEATLNVSRWPVASSAYEPNEELLAEFPLARQLAVAERRTVASDSLDAVCAREAIAPDCLKVDVEGGELDVLRGGDAALRGALVLDVEVEFAELFDGQPLFADVDRHVRERGFALLGLRRMCWRRAAGLEGGRTGYGGQLVQADALYWNRRAVDAALPLPRLLKLAVILAAYRQFDLVLSLLRERAPAELTPAERTQLERALIAPPPAWARIARLLGRRLSASRRRALADALQPGGATIWQDAHHF
jgi:FkbM family methyltransferase